MPIDDLDDLFDDIADTHMDPQMIEAILDLARQIADSVDGAILEGIMDDVYLEGTGAESPQGEIQVEDDATPQERYDRAMDIFKDL